MTAMAMIVGTIWTVMSIVFIWHLYCNHRTYNQRMLILFAIPNDSEWRTLHYAYDEVTYKQHLYALMLLRDPLKLYPAKLAALGRNAGIGRKGSIGRKAARVRARIGEKL